MLRLSSEALFWFFNYFFYYILGDVPGLSVALGMLWQTPRYSCLRSGPENIWFSLTWMSHRGPQACLVIPNSYRAQSSRKNRQRQAHHTFQDSETQVPPDACLLLTNFLPQLPRARILSQPQWMVHDRTSLRLMELNRNSKNRFKYS